MRDFQANQSTTLFNGETLSHGCRGRISRSKTKASNRWSAVVVGLVMLGATSAATAVTAKRVPHLTQVITVGETLSANFFRSPTLGGFEEAVY